ncbi:hypothetical protein CC80DRAFT_525310 [Byssothecium circinans]|uniref:Mediator of RNA polymerase II transcription subunit 1 n=1 Tax=Byssothecium circinans TaxID=147558 RepID=A0A6A5TZR0_9PLEO|nr:hypothetical protein CC80DRAFT_525310 [Byssothecium circinans]
MLTDGGIGMGISMSSMGMGMSMSQLGLSQLGRGDEDERRRRLENVIQMLKARPGRVSEEGIIALCRKEGMEFERAVESDGSVVLTLVIGNEAMCDIAIRKGSVESVKLELASDDDGTFKDSGSNILFKSLTPSRPGQSKVNLMLDQFAGNLDKLLRMDRLSADNGGVQCFKAIFGLHASLKKLFEHEKKIAMALWGEDVGDREIKAEREVLCKKSGRPRMNAGTCLGLSLEYWMDRRYLNTKKTQQTGSAKSKEKANTSSNDTTEDAYPEDMDLKTNKIYSLTIECEASPSSMYSPIRIPPSWISENIEVSKPPEGTDAAVINNILNNNASTIDWLDPKPTYLDSPAGATGDHDAMTIDNAPGRLPNIRFVARFNPPLAVPLPVYANIVNSVGIEYPEDLRATTFIGLALRPQDPDPGMSAMAGGSTPEIASTRRVLSIDTDGREAWKWHKNTLYVPKLEFSRTLESLPFQHPRQLVEILPMLRQYALTTSLLQNTFVDAVVEDPKVGGIGIGMSGKQTSPPLAAPLTPDTNRKGDVKTAEEEDVHIDISLAYSAPTPRLTTTIPHPSRISSAPASSDPNHTDILATLLSPTPSHTPPPLRIAMDVQLNGDLTVFEQNIVPDRKDVALGEEEGVRRVGRALDVCGDFGVWVEWVRREVLKG